MFIQSYLTKSLPTKFQGEMDLSEWPNRYGRGGARIVYARLLDDDRNITTRFYRTHTLSCEFEFNSDSFACPAVFIKYLSESGERILHMSQYDTPGLLPTVLEKGKYRVRFSILLASNRRQLSLLSGYPYGK